MPRHDVVMRVITRWGCVIALQGFLRSDGGSLRRMSRPGATQEQQPEGARLDGVGAQGRLWLGRAALN
jgi:hypothetical protein